MKRQLRVVDPKDIKTESLETKKVEKQNFLPIEDLPSKYLFYPEGTQILGKPLTVLDVKALASMDDNNAEYIVKEVIKRNIKGIDIDDILENDKYYLIFWLRANTYVDSGYEIDFHCPRCDTDSTYNFTVNAFDVEYVNPDVELERELPVSKKKIEFKYLTIGDLDRFAEFKRVNLKGPHNFDLDILEKTYHIESVNGEKLSALQKYELLQENPTDYAYIDAVLDHILFGVKESVNAKCNNPKCEGEPTPVGVQFRHSFFIPRFKL